MEIVGDTITELYVNILKSLKKYGHIRDSRAGRTLELISVTTVLKNPRTRYITEPLRRHNLSYIAKEIDWYLSGNYNAEPIARAAKYWKTIQDANGKVNSNYGAKIFYEKVDGICQFDRVVSHLKKYPNSRRAIFFFHLYPHDWVQMDETKDYVCTIYGHAIINDGKLDLMIYMRSNDVIWGWGNDVPFFTLLQEMMAVELDVPIGTYYHHAGSMHIYENFFYKLQGSEYNNFDPEPQTPFAPLIKEDVDALRKRDYSIKTPFIESFVKWLKAP
jgi:thymidylate synthase